MVNNDYSTSDEKITSRFSLYFTYFMVICLCIIFLITASIPLYSVFTGIKTVPAESIILIAVLLLYTSGFICLLRKHISTKWQLIYLVGGGFIFRLTWALITDSIPVSDFDAIYTSAQSLLEGNTDSFKGLSYFGRFPHMTPYIVFFAGVIKIFGSNALLGMRLINVLFSTSCIFLIYLIAGKVFNNKNKVMISAFLMAVFPASITYVCVYCSENIALPFYLGAIYVFLLVVKDKKSWLLFLLSGFLLGIGHTLRMVGYVPLAAFFMYIFLYYKENILKKIRDCIMIAVTFILVFAAASYALIGAGITDRKIWDGSEPSITSAVRGSNFASGGSWNPEDASFLDDAVKIYDKETVTKMCKDRIMERYSNASPQQLLSFFTSKIASQWGNGDYAGAYWSQIGLEEQNVVFDIATKGTMWYHLTYSIILILSIVGLFNAKERNAYPEINLFYIIFCGFGVMYLILENQCRYAYIAGYLFVIFPVMAYDFFAALKHRLS